jgi:hypothetical protein
MSQAIKLLLLLSDDNGKMLDNADDWEVEQQVETQCFDDAQQTEATYELAEDTRRRDREGY